MTNPSRDFSPEDDEHAFDANELATAAAELIVDQARAYPARTLGVAFAVGYVLGGGLPRFAVRLASMALVRAMTEALLSGETAARVAGGVWRGARARRRPNGRP